MFADQIDYAPPAVSHLNVLRRECRDFRPAKPTSKKDGEHRPIPKPLLRSNVRRVQQRLRLLE
jgi:hypothetical protein